MPPTESQNPFTGTEAYYAKHRPRYGDAAVRYLRERFELDESARVLDLGCGAGQIAVPLAHRVGEVVGMDPNEVMLRKARSAADAAGIENIAWRAGSDADLSEELGTFRLATMGRSFHWMDQERTLERLYDLTEADGGVAILTDGEWLTGGAKAWQRDAYDVAETYVDDLPERTCPDEIEYEKPWDELVAAHGFADVETRTLEDEREWSVDGVVGYVFSLSFCSPEVLGDEKAAFETDLRERLDEPGAEPFVEDAEIRIISGKKG